MMIHLNDHILLFYNRTFVVRASAMLAVTNKNTQTDRQTNKTKIIKVYTGVLT